MKFYSVYIKRGADIIVSSCCLVILLPLLVFVAVWLAMANEGAGVFYRQRRLGRGGRHFTIYKFCTMKTLCDPEGNLLPDDERLTRAGRLLRASMLDELPQLWNVIIGQMSLVGPRPLLEIDSPQDPTQRKYRLSVRPGITGWAQVNGGKLIDNPTKYLLDFWYLDHISALLDIKILSKTAVLFFRQNFHSGKQSADAPAESLAYLSTQSPSRNRHDLDGLNS